MADTKTSGETAAGALDGTELVRIVQAGNNRKTTTGAIGVARVASRLLSSSDILNSFTTPITIVPAPGAGFGLVLLGSSYNYVFGSSPYTSAQNPSLYYGPITEFSFADTGSGNPSIITKSANWFATGAPQNAVDTTAQITNQPLIFWTQGSNPTGGDGTLFVSVIYAVVPLS